MTTLSPALLARVPVLADASAIEALGRGWKVTTPHGVFAVRPTRPDADATIDRAATAWAGEAGFGPPAVSADRATGLIVTRWIEASNPLTPALLRGQPATLRAAGHLLRNLQGSAVRWPRLDLAAALARHHAENLVLSPRLRSRLAAALARLAAHPGVPSHNDPHPGNILATPDGLRLIDWEYAGLNHPAFDLAYVAIEAGLDDADLRNLVEAYGAAAPADLDAARLVVSVLNAAWGAGHGADLAYGTTRLAGAERLAADKTLGNAAPSA